MLCTELLKGGIIARQQEPQVTHCGSSRIMSSKYEKLELTDYIVVEFGNGRLVVIRRRGALQVASQGEINNSLVIRICLGCSAGIALAKLYREVTIHPAGIEKLANRSHGIESVKDVRLRAKQGPAYLIAESSGHVVVPQLSIKSCISAK